MSASNIQRNTSSRKTGGLMMGHDGLTGALWAVLYSASQKAYHLSQIDEMLHRNQTMMAQGGITDYVPIFFSTSRRHASELCEMCKATWGRPMTAQQSYRQRCHSMKTPRKAA